MALAKTKPVRPEYLAVGQRIKACMDARNLDQSTVARGLGIEPQSVQQWIRGQTNPRGYRFKALAALLDVEPWELLGPQADSAIHSPSNERDSGAVHRVPRVSWVSAGQFREVASASHAEAEEWDTPSEPMSRQSFSLRVEGDSMEPEFPSGCVIFIDPQTQPLNGDYVVVALDDSHQATFKQLVLDGAQRYLKPLNSRYPIIPIDREARVCGVVREMRKAYRR